MAETSTAPERTLTAARTNHQARRVLIDGAGRLPLRTRPEPEQERLAGGRSGDDAEVLPGALWRCSHRFVVGTHRI